MHYLKTTNCIHVLKIKGNPLHFIDTLYQPFFLIKDLIMLRIQSCYFLMCKSKDEYTFKKIFFRFFNMHDASDDNFIFNESVFIYIFNQDSYNFEINVKYFN